MLIVDEPVTKYPCWLWTIRIRFPGFVLNIYRFWSTNPRISLGKCPGLKTYLQKVTATRYRLVVQTAAGYMVRFLIFWSLVFYKKLRIDQVPCSLIRFFVKPVKNQAPTQDNVPVLGWSFFVWMAGFFGGDWKIRFWLSGLSGIYVKDSLVSWNQL